MGKKLLLVLVVAVAAFVKGYTMGHDHGSAHQDTQHETHPVEIEV